ncbi:MAG TPA: histidine phosphatase family protein [Phenylobacterium sp.]|nr:histidine phosphatase family protein [Phenylobacterium sp.]
MGNQADRAAGRLIFVKHGQPQIVAGQPPSSWMLSPDGRRAATALAERLRVFAPRALWSSPEPKAHETAQAMGEVFGRSLAVDAGLAEHRADRGPFTSQEEFERRVEHMFSRPAELIMGEESGLDARLRFDAALARVGADDDGTTVIVAHGRIITLWLSHRLGFDPMPFWRSLGLASAAVLSQDGLQMVGP